MEIVQPANDLDVTSINGLTGAVILGAGSGITLSTVGQTITISAPQVGTVTSISSTDGSITVTNPTTTPDLAVVQSPKLTTGRTISITGDLAYTSASFDGSGNVTGVGTLASIIVAGGATGSATVTPIITWDAKGRLTVVSSATITPAASSITGGAALTKADDTNVTLTLGGTPSTALLAAASITAGWTGTLAVSRGGTGGGAASITLFNNITGFSAAGTTGTTSTNLVFSTSPSLVTPALGVATYTTLSGGNITDSGLTAGRVTFAGTAGILSDDADFTFSVDTLTITKIAATTFTGNITTSTINIVTDTTTGTKFGTATNQKISFYNSTPIVQPTGDLTTAIQNLGLAASVTIAANTIASHTFWGQTYTGAADVSGSLTAVGNITGGASSMTITAGTGNSRTLTLQSTTSGGVATNGIVIDASQHITLEGVTSTGATGTGKFVFDTAPTFASTINVVTGIKINGAATSGKILIGDGTNMVLSANTFPNASATSGKTIRSDGTNWIASAYTEDAPGTNTNLMQSDGTNWKSVTIPTWNQNTTGSAASLSISGQTGLLTFTGLASTSRIKTIRDAADTILELGGSYTPTGTWTSMTFVTPALGTPASGVMTNVTGTAASLTAGKATILATARSLWGNNFDGSAALTGSIAVAVNQNAATTITADNTTSGTGAYAAFYAQNTSTGAFGGMFNLNPSFSTNGLQVANSVVLQSANNTNGLRMMTLDAYDVTIGTGNTARMTFQASTGFIGVGTAAPLNDFYVNKAASGAQGGTITVSNTASAAAGGEADIGFRNSAGFNNPSGAYYSSRIASINGGAENSDMVFYNYRSATAAGDEGLRIKSDGTIQMLKYGAGTATFDGSGNISSVSDERFKDIQGGFTAGLNEILQINPILYKYNKISGFDQENVYAGFSAQNVMKYIPEAVGKGSDGYYSFNDRPVLAAAINAIKELEEQIAELRVALNLAKKDRKVEEVKNEDRIIKSKPQAVSNDIPLAAINIKE